MLTTNAARFATPAMAYKIGGTIGVHPQSPRTAAASTESHTDSPERAAKNNGTATEKTAS